MKNQGKTSWLFAALVSLSTLFVSGVAYSGDSGECSRMCSVTPVAQERSASEADWFSREPGELACRLDSPLSPKTWVDWETRLVKELHRNQMASNSSDTGDRQPARSNN